AQRGCRGRRQALDSTFVSVAGGGFGNLQHVLESLPQPIEDGRVTVKSEAPPLVGLGAIVGCDRLSSATMPVDLRYDRFTWATGGPWAGRLTVIARRDGARSEWMELLRQRQAITVYGPVRSAQPCDNDPIDADKSRSAKVRAGHGAREASLGARLGGRDVGPALDELPPRGAHGRGGRGRPGRVLCVSGGARVPQRRPRTGGKADRRARARPGDSAGAAGGNEAGEPTGDPGDQGNGRPPGPPAPTPA